MAAILNQSEFFFFRFTILGYSVTCSQNFMQIGEPCFWTTLHGFTGDTLLNNLNNFYMYISVKTMLQWFFEVIVPTILAFLKELL